VKQERLQKVLAQAGIASRRASEQLITAGRVTVNDQVITELGTKVDPQKDRIAVDGKPARVAEKKLYVLLHKPAGYVTTMKDPQGRPIVTELIKGVQDRLFPVGRLDYNTEGVLLLTNDGELANRLAHPRYGVEKEYHVRVRGTPTEEQLRLLAAGVELDDGPTSSAKVGLARVSGQNSWISLAIHEGRYRQVRRMCAAVGLMVVRLKRVRYGFLELGELKPGEYRMLSETEVGMLENRPGAERLRQKVVTSQNVDEKDRQITTKKRVKRQVG
jgi:23S rRNA pseudouridine2605 synthase